MALVIPAFVLCVIAIVVGSICSKRNQYNKWLAKAKAENKYQTITLDTLIKICETIGKDDFMWKKTWGYMSEILNSEKPNLLWYRIDTTPQCFVFMMTQYDYFLIDIPWFSCVLFKKWEKRYVKQQRDAKHELARCKNSTNDVLQDIQKKLDTQISQNLEKMKEAATQQEQVLSRLF